MKPKIAIVLDISFTKRDYKRFGISTLKKKFNVFIFDFTKSFSIKLANHKFSKKTYKCEGYYSVKNISIFESGAILIYLGEESGKFYDKDKRTLINQWLMGQMGYIGPMLGQHHQFHHYNPGKSEFGEKRYFKISERIYKELNERLSQSKYLAYDSYSIADIATFPWIARHEWHDIGLKKYKHLARWYSNISDRDAVKIGYDLLKKGEEIPKV